MIYSGFYDSFGGDRKYSGDQIGMIFDGIMSDGIIYGWPSKEESFKVSVKSSADRTVEIAKGRAWFDHRWIFNDYPIIETFEPLELPETTARIDAVYLSVDKNRESRVTELKIKKGVPAEYYGGVSNPERPSVKSDDDKITNHVLAYVKVEYTDGAYVLSVDDARGTAETPWVSYHLTIDDKTEEAVDLYFAKHFVWDPEEKHLTIIV